MSVDGTFEKSRDVRLVVAFGGKPDTKILFSRRIAASTQASGFLKKLMRCYHHNSLRAS
jgi:hypothetical protein